MKLARTLTILTLTLAAVACDPPEDAPVAANAGHTERSEEHVDIHAFADPIDLGDHTAGELIEIEPGVHLAVPEPGASVAIDLLYEDGESFSVALETDDFGAVQLAYPELHYPEAPDGWWSTAGGAIGGSCPSACSDRSFATLFSSGAAWSARYDWRYNHQLAAKGKQGSINALKSGINGIVNSRNSCGMADTVSATARYRGLTTRRPAPVRRNGAVTCDAGRLADGINSIGWGNLGGSGPLAVTCVRAINGTIVAADMTFNNQRAWYLGNKAPASCTNQFSMRGVATHEAGHAFGLGHSGCAQTMAPAVGTCDGSIRTLGRGDVRGLRFLY